MFPGQPLSSMIKLLEQKNKTPFYRHVPVWELLVINLLSLWMGRPTYAWIKFLLRRPEVEAGFLTSQFSNNVAWRRARFPDRRSVVAYRCFLRVLKTVVCNVSISIVERNGKSKTIPCVYERKPISFFNFRELRPLHETEFVRVRIWNKRAKWMQWAHVPHQL